jgi:hypothetical protein
MREQLPQNVSHFVSSFFGATGHQDHAEGFVCLGRRPFVKPLLAVRRTATTDANVSPSQGELDTVHQVRLQEVLKSQVDWSSQLEFEVEVETFREPH